MFKAILLVFLGGGLGSVLRFTISKISLQQIDKNLPLATFFSNMIACLILGIVIYLLRSKAENDSASLIYLLVIGFCGGLSTFSTFSLESLQLLRQGMYTYFFLNLILSVAIGMAVIYFAISKYSPTDNI